MDCPQSNEIHSEMFPLTQQLAPQHECVAKTPLPDVVDRGVDDLPGHPLSVTLVESVDELRSHLPAWERLVEKAVEPNIFYEPWMLLPGWEQYGRETNLQVALIYAPCRKNPKGDRVLCGLLPLERHRGLGRLPVGNVQAWRYPHCFLRTPLVRCDYVEETLTALLDWLRDDPQGAPVLRLDYISGEGTLHRKLIEILYRRGHTVWLRERYDRAMLVPATDAESYSRAASGRKRRHEARRQRKRLAEHGDLESVILEDEGDIDRWVDDFLRLEAKGWKGRTATAFACHEADRKFFRSVVYDAFRRRRLMMLALRFNGQTIAQKCNFIAGDGGFAFKIAYDEAYQQYSPGVLLEIDNIAALHDRPTLRWMDSCADANHPMIDHLWRERRLIESLWIATGRRFGDFAVSIAPPMRWLREKLSK